MEVDMIKWTDVERKAKRLTDIGLAGTILGIQDALEAADALDRETGTDRGGEYRDEISVYRSEQRRRCAAPDPLDVCREVLQWARTPQDHGGNPYGHTFVKLAQRVLGE